MKIICVGYWKTGTKSMTKALTTLGYNVYDFEEQIMYLKHLWDKFFDGTVTDQDIYETFKDVDVIIDGPTVAFWSEIYKVFPEAKIIFTVRDEDSWWRSFKNMQDKFFEKSQLKFALLLTPTGYSLLQFANKIFGFLQGIETFSVIKMNWCANERLYKMKYRMHNAFVHQTVSSDAMLEHNVKDGWKPLCEYLGKEIPDEPYPHQNKNASLFLKDLHKRPLLGKIMREMVISVTVIVSVFAFMIGYYYYCYLNSD